jgi:hypothetical protein
VDVCEEKRGPSVDSHTFFTKSLTHFKFNVFHGLLEKEKTGELLYGAAFMFLLCCNCLFVIIAWMTVYIEPLAAGSGEMLVISVVTE